MTLFEQYGINEVVNGMFYSIHQKTDGSGDVYYMPALFLDTLKTSSIEKSADSSWAQGGYGNTNLIGWDSGKTINVSLEDALCSPASLGLCWSGVLSADWKDAHVNFQTDVCSCQNPVKRISKTEKAFYPRNDGMKGCISNLLPQISSDAVDDYFGLLKISSVVDGTDIRGFGRVRNHSYRWKMAIESVVKSISVVPDRFFDVKGRTYPIDWDRKVSVHSLPTYENYKDAIIYKINSRGKCLIPPAAKIIFDEAVENQGTFTTLELTRTVEESNELVERITLAKLLESNGYKLYEEGYFSDGEQENYYIPFEKFENRLVPDSVEETTYKYKTIAFKLTEDGVKQLLPICRTEIKADMYEGTLVNYLQNHAHTNTRYFDINGSVVNTTLTCPIREAQYLAIIVDNNNEYIPLVGKLTKVVEDEDTNAKTTVIWYKPDVDIEVSQFKGLDMWLRFDSINEMIYFLITKYNNNIVSINAATVKALNRIDSDTWAVDDNYTTVTKNTDKEAEKVQGRLWAYLNPTTMTPYADDYWFNEGEPYIVKSLTIAPPKKQLKANRITVRADTWAGLYMFEGETYIRNRETGKDEHLQIRIPRCKVKADQTLTLEAGGEPVVFNLDLEVATPRSGKMMEITAYETRTKMLEGENGCYYPVDGSTEVLSE